MHEASTQAGDMISTATIRSRLWPRILIEMTVSAADQQHMAPQGRVMNDRSFISKYAARSAALASFALMLILVGPRLAAQNADLQQRVADLKESTAKNKEELKQYTWLERVTVSLKGQERKQERFQVRLGPDGKPVKTPLDAPAATQDSAGRGGRLRERVVEKKKEEFKEYAAQMKALAERYIPPDKDAIQDAYSKGNISIEPIAETPDRVKLVIQNYVKPHDSMTLIVDKAEKRLASISIVTYMDDPSDIMKLTVQFGRLPDGPNHVDNATMEGVSKQLTVATQNSDYHKL